MWCKGQLEDEGEQGLTAAEQFYALAAESPHSRDHAPQKVSPHKNLQQNQP